MADYAPGDLLEVITKDKTYKGTFVPQEGKALVIKLTSGYNLGILHTNVQSVNILEKHKEATQAQTSTEQNTDLPKISILHTGGTIASKVDYKTGGVIARFTPEELLSLFPELHSLAHIESSLIANMWSENMRFVHYNIIAKAIEQEIAKGVDGIIVTQGTDTIHYTSAALSFMFKDATIPIIVLGAQRSSDRGSSDAGMNLICAVETIINSDFGGVGVCMHAGTQDTICHILPGTKCRKMHSTRRDAFQPINASAYLTVNHDEKSIAIIDNSYKKKKAMKDYTPKLFKEDIKVALLKTHTNMYASQFEALKDFDGIVFEGTGVGLLPISVTDEHTEEHAKIAHIIKEFATKKVAAVTTQTIYGRVCNSIYAPGREAQDMGVLGTLLDMTAETAFIKLAWLLSNYSKEEARKLFMEDLVGEINKYSPIEDFQTA